MLYAKSPPVKLTYYCGFTGMPETMLCDVWCIFSEHTKYYNSGTVTLKIDLPYKGATFLDGH